MTYFRDFLKFAVRWSLSYSNWRRMTFQDLNVELKMFFKLEWQIDISGRDKRLFLISFVLMTGFNSKAILFTFDISIVTAADRRGEDRVIYWMEFGI